MEEFWARVLEPSGQAGPNYWEYFAACMAQHAQLHERSTILDLGTYDGNLLIKAIQKLKQPGCGIGVDIDPDGFRQGLGLASQLGLRHDIHFVQADGSALAFPSNCFDAVLANFVGWSDCFDFERMEFITPDRMMPEIFRVLKPGGQVGIGAWVEQSDLDWISETFKQVLPEYPGNQIYYSKENPAGQKIILESAGFEGVRVIEQSEQFLSPDAETWWRQMRMAASTCFQQIPDQKTLVYFQERVFSALQTLRRPEGILFSKSVSFAFGNKPR